MFFGHISYETAREVGSVRVESLDSIAAEDAYTHMGWVSVEEGHRERGEIRRHRVNVSTVLAAD
jgi:hypothetical protein